MIHRAYKLVINSLVFYINICCFILVLHYDWPGSLNISSIWNIHNTCNNVPIFSCFWGIHIWQNFDSLLYFLHHSVQKVGHIWTMLYTFCSPSETDSNALGTEFLSLSVSRYGHFTRFDSFFYISAQKVGHIKQVTLCIS